MSTLLAEFKSITGSLNEAKVEYAVCGGWAMAIHGLPRATLDIDLLIQMDDLNRAWELAKQNGYDVEVLPPHFADGAIEIRRISKLDRGSKQLYTLDFLLVTSKLKDVWRQREQVEWPEGRTWVVSKRGLIELKQISGRDQDIVDIKRLEGRELMADMSPEAVGQRLRLMGELWELSVKLMNSKPAATEIDDKESLENFVVYVFDWCPQLVTENERAARRHLLGLRKVDNAEVAGKKNALRKTFLSTDPAILKLVANGEEEFYRSVRLRLAADESSERFMNRCSKCGELTRTPKASQCWSCHYSWHKTQRENEEL